MFGLTAFGGPAAHIALMNRELVQNKKWMSDSHFLDLIAITSLIPGPNSTEMTMHCGYHRAKLPGLILAGTCFIIPAAIITLLFAISYNLISHLEKFQLYLLGVKPIVILLIISAIITLGKKVFIRKNICCSNVYNHSINIH